MTPLKEKAKGKLKKKMENPIVHKDCFAYLSSGGKKKGVQHSNDYIAVKKIVNFINRKQMKIQKNVLKK